MKWFKRRMTPERLGQELTKQLRQDLTVTVEHIPDKAGYYVFVWLPSGVLRTELAYDGLQRGNVVRELAEKFRTYND